MATEKASSDRSAAETPRPAWRRRLRRALLLLGAAVAVLAAIVLVRTFTNSSRQLQVAPVERVALDSATLAARLGEAIRFRTVSTKDPTAPRRSGGAS